MSRDAEGIIQTKFARTGDVGLGGITLDKLWPISYSTPGGPFPQRIQFNQLFRLLSALAVEINKKGPYLEYSTEINYAAGACVTGSDGIRYQCRIANGPGSTLRNPVADSSGSWLYANRPFPGFEFKLGYVPTATQLLQMGALQRAGQSLLITDYPLLYAAWGSTKLYGGADSTHFYLPDDRGLFDRYFSNGSGIDVGAYVTRGGTITSGSPIITSIGTDPIEIGMSITGTGIPAGATVIAFTTTTVTMSANATASSSSYNQYFTNRTNRGDGTTGDNVGTMQPGGNLKHSHDSIVSYTPGGTVNRALGTDATATGLQTNVVGGTDSRPINRSKWGGIIVR